MQNTFAQSGNDSKCFFKKNHLSEFVCGTQDPPPFMEKSILNFHFDYLIISLKLRHVWKLDYGVDVVEISVEKRVLNILLTSDRLTTAFSQFGDRLNLGLLYF